MDAGDPPVPALHRLPAILSCGRVLPDLRPGRRLAAFARRALSLPCGARRIADPRIHAPAVRGLLTAARDSADPCDFALVAMPGLLGLRIFEVTSADIAEIGEERGHRVLRVCGKGTKIVLVPLPPAAGRAIDRATGSKISGPILLNGRGARMDRRAATRRLRRPAQTTGLRTKVHPPMPRHAFVTHDARYRRGPPGRPPGRARTNLDRHPS